MNFYLVKRHRVNSLGYYPYTFDLLAIYRNGWQDGGNFLNCKNSLLASVFKVDLEGNIYNNENKVLGEREQGWTPATGTADKGAFDTETATTLDNSRRIKAIEDLLRTHGLLN